LADKGANRAGVAPTIDDLARSGTLGSCCMGMRFASARDAKVRAFACMGDDLTYQQLDFDCPDCAHVFRGGSGSQSAGGWQRRRIACAIMLPKRNCKVNRFGVMGGGDPARGALRRGSIVNPLFTKPRRGSSTRDWPRTPGARAIFRAGRETFGRTWAAVRQGGKFRRGMSCVSFFLIGLR